MRTTIVFGLLSVSALGAGQDNSDYAAHPCGDGFEAVNASQGIAARFTPTEISVVKGSARFAMRLGAYGYAGSLQKVSPAMPRADSNRLEYQRGTLTEWYVNGADGLEQGFTLSRRPGVSKGQPLTVAIDLSGNVKPSLNTDAKGLTLTTKEGDSFRYSGLTTYDRNGRALRSWLELRGHQLLIGVADTDAVFPITIDPKLVATLTATGSGTALGYAVSISGGTIVSLGSSGIYVYSKPATGWTNMTQTALLTTSDGGGFSTVAVSGNTIAAAGNSEVYVYIEPAGGWTNMTETAILTASDNPSFGLRSVALIGNTIVAGAPETDFIGIRSSPIQPATQYGPGAAYVFEKPAGGWVNAVQNAKLTASDGQTYDDFGWAVSIFGDTIAVGAPNASINGNSLQGGVYVFVRPATAGWTNATQTAKLSGSPLEFVNVLGQSVSIFGNTILAGGYGEAYVFVEPSGGWGNTTTQNASLSDSAGRTTCQQGGCFGYSVALDSNYAMVGAPGKFAPGVNSVADLYLKPAGGWTNMTQSARVSSPIDNGDSAYGWSVSVSGSTFVVGYPDQYGSGNYVFVY